MSKSPNILLVITDQQHPDLIGHLGKIPVKTPHLDALCKQGTTFTRAYTPCPLCTPARASILSGQYASSHGAWSIGVDTPDDIVSLPQILKETAGYRTGIIGKSHFKTGNTPGSIESFPKSQDWPHWENWNGPWFGFDYAKINIAHVHEPQANSMHYGVWLRQQGLKNPGEYFFERGDKEIANGTWELPQELHHSRWVADETLAYLKNHRESSNDNPFFLSVNFADPHPPYAASSPWDRMYDDVELHPPIRKPNEGEGKSTLYQSTLDNSLESKGWTNGIRPAGQHSYGTQATIERSEDEETRWRAYLGMQSMVDHHFGRILEGLDQLNLQDDTLVIFTSDHGDFMGDHWMWSKGGSHYDGCVRIPFVARWPKQIPANRQSDSLQSLVDLAPTLLSVAGVEPVEAMQGIDQSNTWRTPESPSRDGVWIQQRIGEGLHVNSWITAERRFSAYSYTQDNREEFELYNLADDPNEFENLANDPIHASECLQLFSDMNRHQLTHSGAWLPRTCFA